VNYPTLTLELARTIESAEAHAAVDCAEMMRALQPRNRATIDEIAGSFAVYCGPGSPITQAVGLGLNGPISAEEFDRLEEFYFRQGEAVRVETCPLADASLFAEYGKRGYRVTEFSSVMAREVVGGTGLEGQTGVEIRRAGPDELDLWTNTVAQGFAETYAVTEELLGVMKMFAMGKNAECYLALVDGQIAGGATLAVRGRVAGFFGASTLTRFRRRGVQTALLDVRLRRAAEANCELAVSLAQPASASERNILRSGFRVLYTRMKFERELPAEWRSRS